MIEQDKRYGRIVQQAFDDHCTTKICHNVYFRDKSSLPWVMERVPQDVSRIEDIAKRVGADRFFFNDNGTVGFVYDHWATKGTPWYVDTN